MSANVFPQRSSSKGGETSSETGDVNSSSGNSNSGSGTGSSSSTSSGCSGERKKRRLRDKGKEAAKGVLSVVKTVLMILASLVGLALLIVVLIDTRAVASEEMLAEGCVVPFGCVMLPFASDLLLHAFRDLFIGWSRRRPPSNSTRRCA
jgi:hypothetical protein